MVSDTALGLWDTSTTYACSCDASIARDGMRNMGAIRTDESHLEGVVIIMKWMDGCMTRDNKSEVSVKRTGECRHKEAYVKRKGVKLTSLKNPESEQEKGFKVRSLVLQRQAHNTRLCWATVLFRCRAMTLGGYQGCWRRSAASCLPVDARWGSSGCGALFEP